MWERERARARCGQDAAACANARRVQSSSEVSGVAFFCPAGSELCMYALTNLVVVSGIAHGHDVMIPLWVSEQRNRLAFRGAERTKGKSNLRLEMN